MRRVLGWFRGFEEMLRGGAAERSPQLGALVRAVFLLGGFYGVCMGLYAAMRGQYGTGWQMLASALKIPLLFLLTLLVTFPSLYVFAALSRSSLRFRETLLLLMRAIAVSIVLLASFGPITAFFTLSTESYPFMVLLNVVLLAVAGFAGIKYLSRAMEALFAEPPGPPPPADPEDRAVEAVTAMVTRRVGGEHRAAGILRIWIYIYGIVGAQMAWILRPFIGSPKLEFALFRARESNFFRGVLEALRRLFE